MPDSEFNSMCCIVLQYLGIHQLFCIGKQGYFSFSPYSLFCIVLIHIIARVLITVLINEMGGHLQWVPVL